MLIEILLAIFLGILAGTITGLIPGIHINLISAFLISLSTGVLLKVNSTYLILFITAMAITHTFLDFIPSIFFGCPDTDTELSILPGHTLLKQGHGYQATMLTAYGSLYSVIVLGIIAYPAIKIMKAIYADILKVMPHLLIATSFFLIILEKNKLNALIVFGLSGILGFLVLGSGLEINQPLLPLLTGLFGCSTLVLSIKNKTKIPEQKIKEPKITSKRPFISSLIASPLCSFLPGLGSGQAAVIGNLVSKKDFKNFLVLLGATNTLVMGFSFLSLYAISKTRTGAAVAIKEIFGAPSESVLILIIATIIISGIISFFLTRKIAKYFSKNIQKLNYSRFSLILLIFLFGLNLFISGGKGLLVLIVATITGLYCISLNVRRTNMMGCLLVPTIFLYKSLLSF